MATDILPPKFLSLEFHTRFFPRLLRDGLRRKRTEAQGTTFSSTTEMTILLAVCLILAVLGIPLALTRGSILGWILTVLGVGGIVGLLVISVGAQWDSQPTYDNFLIGIFFFFVSLGVIIGIPVGMEHRSFWRGALASLAGLVGGYVLGILAGLRLQHLGWMAAMVNMVAGFVAIVLGAAALVMLLVLTVR